MGKMMSDSGHSSLLATPVFSEHLKVMHEKCLTDSISGIIFSRVFHLSPSRNVGNYAGRPVEFASVNSSVN